MALIGIEKIGENTNALEQNDAIRSMNNLGNINNNFKERNDVFDNSGMNGDRLKREGNLINLCLSTILGTLIFLLVISLLIIIGFKYANFDLKFFPTLETYTLKDYNDGIRRCFVMLSGSLVLVCILVKFAINNSIRMRFKKWYLKKLGIYLYDGFLVLLNAVSYILVAIGFFYLVNSIHTDLISLYESSKIVENVNINTIEIFKWVIVIIISIFGVLNSFTGLSIVHKKNKFVLEDNFER